MASEGRSDGQARLAYGAVGVSDIERSLWFYCDVLGFSLVGSTALTSVGKGRRPRAFHLVCPGGGIDLLTMGDSAAASEWLWDDRQIGVRHIGMKVSNVDEWAERLRSVGAPIRVDPVDAVGNVRLAFFEDPDGANLEVVQGHIDYAKVWDHALVAAEEATGVPVPGSVRFDHVAVSTTHLDATLTFYERLFGFAVIGQLFYEDDPRGLTITMLSAGGAKLEVFTFTTPTTKCPWEPGADFTGLRHVGIEVGDVTHAAARAVAAGATAAVGPDDQPLGSRAVIIDPDGVPLELVAR
jgi:catechol 2,3-dioxygenase-like lactoylglutathione lyase family enzyme